MSAFQSSVSTPLKRVYPMALAAVIALGPSLPAYCLPSGGTSISGGVTFSNPDANTLNVSTGANRSIAQYTSFSVSNGQTVNFILPGATAAILNRVTGPSASNIAGNINTPNGGQVLLVNPNGVLIGPTAQINVGSFMATTMGISNSNFLSDNWLFTQSNSNSTAQIVNNGSIVTAPGGYVVLAGRYINNTGNIVADGGKVHFGVGDTIQLTLDNNVVTQLQITQSVQKKINTVSAGILNTGTVSANQIFMKAQLKTNFYDAVVNSGNLTATSLVASNGVIELTAATDNGFGVLNNSGQLLINNPTSLNDRITLTSNDTLINSGSLTAADAGTVELSAGKSLTGTGAIDTGKLVMSVASGNLSQTGMVTVATDQSTINALQGSITLGSLDLLNGA
ncbi:MAG: filamentous hemagglutinin N-terminal domain-containing protein, partial [Cyanobacteria bacterium HKST-UBA05]|nr:filamentous hemagglutinin N-terminal domain-containing protein [Cyanobacteria bacterium HKST-UBA05]